jgi:trimeric autotransporter adhesin
VQPALNAQIANRVLIGPASGSDAAPTFRALQAEDLPAATISARGAIIPGAGLSMTDSTLNHTNAVASGTYYKVEVDTEGHVVSGATALEAADIPDLDASKITTGSFGSGIIQDQAILATKLANYSTTKFGEAPPTADFIGQYFFNPLEKDLFLWDGNVWNPVGVSIGEIVFAGTYNASGNVIETTSPEGSAVGLTIGQPLPSPSPTFNKYYVIVASGGTGTTPAPEVVLQPPDIILCNGTAWVEIDVSSTYVAQNALQVAFTPAANLGSTNVQAALEEVSTECRNVNNVASGILDEAYGGTGYASYTKGDLLAASGTVGLAKLAIGTNGQVLTADSAQTAGMKWATPASGTVLSVNATAPLFVVSGTTTPHITVSGATTSAVGVVQLSDSTSTTSSTLAATPTAVKSAYDLANAALPEAGGTITGQLLIGNTGSFVFEGATNDAFETTLTVADPTADRTITLPNVTGTVITTGDSGTVTNAMLAGSIADTKLSTISTAGKVSNSATTATSANTNNAIVARDGSGNFSAGTISATIDEGTF